MTHIIGKIVGGMGKGSLFIPYYSKKIEQKLHFIPFPGTLNVEVDEENKKRYHQQKEKLEKSKLFSIEPFENFGRVSLIPVNLTNDKISAAIIIPEKTTHENNIIEIIADKHIKETLSLQENQTLKIQLV